MNKKDLKEMQPSLDKLRFKSFSGCANNCSNCKHTGHFGSISQYECESTKIYILCGWCGHIEEIAK